MRIMKKTLLTAVACASLGFTAQAQLPAGTLAPNFTMVDINGNSHTLYDYLDQGYNVILDFSGAWCTYCWQLKQTGVLNNLMNQYGPSGTVQPGKVMVIFIEAESSNTTDQLYGIGLSPSDPNATTANATYGDWVTGAQYPIIDNSSMNAAYGVSGLPAFAIIGRDRLVIDAWAGYGSVMANVSWWMDIINDYPVQYAPSSTYDAKLVPYSGTRNFICSANPTVKFQNYSATNYITTASIQIIDAATNTVAATQNWTGNLAPMDIATVNIPTFTPSAPGPYKIKVNVANDSYTANDESGNEFRVVTPSGVLNLPFSENFQGSSVATNIFAEGDPLVGIISGYQDNSGNPVPIIGADGSQTTALRFNFYNNQTGTADVHLSNFNTQGVSNPVIHFDVAYAQYDGIENDKIQVMISNDCGATWTEVWSKSGAGLATRSKVNNNIFVPSSASEWRSESISLTAHKGNSTFIKIRGISNYGNMGYIDNITLENSTSISEVINDGTIKVYPNPATNEAQLSFTINKTSHVQVHVFDMMGRVVSTIADATMNAGMHNLNISTANLPAGIYNIKIQTPAGSQTERLTVVK